MMRWMLWLGAGVALVGLTVVVVGALLPTSHTASRTVRVALTPDALYGVLSDVDRYQSWRTDIDGSDLAFGGAWTYQIAPAPGGSDLTMTENGEVYNVMFRFMAKFVFGYHATMDGFIKNLQARK